MKPKRTASLVAASVAIGLAGLGLIQDSEGLRLKPYRDSVKVATVCWGHTGPDVRMGVGWTRKACEAVFAKDVAQTEAGLNRCIKTKLNPFQSAAVVSLAYNVGVPKVCGSTLVKHINTGNMQAAAKEFPRWSYAGGVKLKSLYTRRLREQALFVRPYTDAEANRTWPELKLAMSVK